MHFEGVSAGDDGRIRGQHLRHRDFANPDQVPYRLSWRDSANHEHLVHDPYCFPPLISDFDLGLFAADFGYYAAPLAKSFSALLFVDRTTATRGL